MLTPMEIHNHQFKKGFRGYSENEVDDFLDRIVADFEKLLRDNERLKNQINSNEKEIEQYRKLEKSLNETLMVAQRTADEVISSARKNAEMLKENTALECQNIRDQAQHEANQQLADAKIKRDAILTEYSRLVREKNAFLLKLRTSLESELAITQQTLDALPHVEEPPKVSATQPAPVEKVPEVVTQAEPVEEIPDAVTEAEPVEKISPPVKEVPKSEPILIDDYAEMNLVDVSTKPVDQKRAAVSDDTKTYKPVKKSAGGASL
ncbi:MAG: DivIVA domain-containing protein [Selenomonadaceae bacterium]|nr:DivIVA domain-containing protein [Selenomonadaceae bacterium]